MCRADELHPPIVAVMNTRDDESPVMSRIRSSVACAAARPVFSDNNAFFRALYLGLIELSVAAGDVERLRALAIMCV